MQHRDRDWLYEEFIVKNRDAKDIGAQCGVTAVQVRWWARFFGFKRRRYGSKKVNDKFFSSIKTEQQAYWLGFISADGSVQNRPAKRVLSLILSAKDQSHLETFREHIGSEHRIYEYEREGHPHCQLDVPSQALVSDLCKLGVVPAKSLILEPPKLKERLIRHWIRGYFDGDGCAYISPSGQIRVSFLGTKPVLDFVALKLGLNSQPRPYRVIWRLDAHGNGLGKRIYSQLYNGSTVCLSRKRDKFEQVLKGD